MSYYFLSRLSQYLKNLMKVRNLMKVTLFCDGDGDGDGCVIAL